MPYHNVLVLDHNNKLIPMERAKAKSLPEGVELVVKAGQPWYFKMKVIWQNERNQTESYSISFEFDIERYINGLPTPIKL
jgi:hypothetical protein